MWGFFSTEENSALPLGEWVNFPSILSIPFIVRFHFGSFKKEHPQTPFPPCFCPSLLVLEPFPQLHPKATPEGSCLWSPSLRTKLGIKPSMDHVDAEALNERGKRGLGVAGDGLQKVAPQEQFPMEFLPLGFSLPAPGVFSFLPALWVDAPCPAPGVCWMIFLQDLSSCHGPD